MKIVKIADAFIGTLNITGQTVKHYAYGKDRREVIEKLFSLYWQYKTKI